ITAIKGPPSINDKGQVAFAAQVNGGESIFVADSVGLRNITPGFISGTRTFSSTLQINNFGLVAAQDRVSGSPPVFLIRTWDSVVVNSSTVIARTAAGGYCNGGLRAGQSCVDNTDCPPDPTTGQTGVCVRGSAFDSLL